MSNQSKPLESPGIAFNSVLNNSKLSTLKSLIGPSILESVKLMDAELLTEEKISNLAVNVLNPIELLQDFDKRLLFLTELPQHKLAELSMRIGVREGVSDAREINANISSSKSLQDLHSFFGIVTEERVVGHKKSDISQADADYALFDHQRKVVDRVEKALNIEPNKVLLHMPTGAGKTRTAMNIIASHLRNNNNSIVVWLAQNAELLEQAADEFENAWRHLGNRTVELVRFWGIRNPDLETVRDGVIVAGLAKMASYDNRNPNSMLRLADRSSLTVIDEAHQATAPTYSSVINALYTKRIHNKLLGLTATPGRSWTDENENRNLSDFFDRCKVTLEVENYDDPVEFLLDNQYLARPKFQTISFESNFNLSEDQLNTLSYEHEIPDEILNSIGKEANRNKQIISAAKDLLTRHKRLIVFAPSVENAKLISAILTLQGYESNTVFGETNLQSREQILRRFKSSNNDPMVLVNFGVLTTGFDAPNISAALIARPTKSLVLYSQMVGRAIRGIKAGGNAEAEIVTVVDTNLPGFGKVSEAFNFWENSWDN